MIRNLVLLAAAASVCAGTSMRAYIGQVNQLLASHRATAARLAAPAQATADALSAGGSFYLDSTGIPAWFYEGIGRAGGIMQTQPFNQDTLPHPGDVVGISYTASTYRNALKIANRLTPRKVVVVAFGPRPLDGRQPFTNWVESLTPWNADDDLTLFGNVLSLWALEGELAAATARQGNTLVFWQSTLVPGGPARNAHYTGQMFHNGFPQMEPIDAGILSAAYLDTIAALLERITRTELPQISAAGRLLAQRGAAGNPPSLVADSHLLPFLGIENNPLFRYVADPSQLGQELARSGLLVDVGYSGVDLELWREVRLAQANAVWITGELPDQGDISGHGDIFINQHWELGDASIPVKGYDVRLLPVSGIAQLFIYELLVKAAAEP